MKTLTRVLAAALTALVLAIPVTAHADSPNSGGTVTHSTGSQLTAHFMTVDSTGCVRNDLFIHGVAGSLGAIDADVQSYNLCTDTLLLLTGGTNYAATVTVDEALQTGYAAGSILTYDKFTGSPLWVTVDLNWKGYGGLTTTPAAPGLSPNTVGFHVTTPYVNVTYNGIGSTRAASVTGAIWIRGFSFPADSLQTDLTSLSAGSSNFIVAFRP